MTPENKLCDICNRLIPLGKEVKLMDRPDSYAHNDCIEEKKEWSNGSR